MNCCGQGSAAEIAPLEILEAELSPSSGPSSTPPGLLLVMTEGQLLLLLDDWLESEARLASPLVLLN